MYVKHSKRLPMISRASSNWGASFLLFFDVHADVNADVNADKDAYVHADVNAGVNPDDNADAPTSNIHLTHIKTTSNVTLRYAAIDF